MECSVCYGETGPFQKLCCGHDFCMGCIKTWYLKGTGETSSCPMCRAPIYFRGFHKVRNEWNEEAWDTKCTEVFGAALDECFEDACDFADGMPRKIARQIFRTLIEDFKDIDRTYRVMRSEQCDPEFMEDVFYAQEMYSDRHLDEYIYFDDPITEKATRYPALKLTPRSGARQRASEDTWFSLGLFLLL